MAGMYAEACQRHAAAASKKKQGSKGCHLNGSGWARIVSDPQLVAEIDWVDAGEVEAEHEKASCQQVRLDRQAKLSHLNELRDCRRQAWEEYKADYATLVEIWEQGG